MASAGGLSRRRVAAATAPESNGNESLLPGPSTHESNGTTHGHAGTALEGGNRIAFDPRDLSNDDVEEHGGKLPKLTILEEILLLGLKDKQVSYGLSFCEA